MDITTFMNDVNHNKWLLQMVLDRTSINTLKTCRLLNKDYKKFIDNEYKIPYKSHSYPVYTNIQDITNYLIKCYNYTNTFNNNYHVDKIFMIYNVFYEFILLHKSIKSDLEIINHIYSQCKKLQTRYTKNEEYIHNLKLKMIIDYWLEDFYPYYISKQNKK